MKLVQALCSAPYSYCNGTLTRREALDSRQSTVRRRDGRPFLTTHVANQSRRHHGHQEEVQDTLPLAILFPARVRG